MTKKISIWLAIFLVIFAMVITFQLSIGGMIGQRPIRGSDETEPFVAMQFVAGGGWDAPTITGHLDEGTQV